MKKKNQIFEILFIMIMNLARKMKIVQILRNLSQQNLSLSKFLENYLILERKF